MPMKMDVKAELVVLMTVTQMNGLVQSLENASPLLKFAIGFQIVQKEKMKIISLKDDTVM